VITEEWEMKANIKSFMRVGLIHFMAYPETMKGEGPIVETLTEILKDDYFDFLEISWIKDDQTRENARDLIKQCHIGLAYGSQPRVLTTGLDINFCHCILPPCSLRVLVLPKLD
jgi:hypothetical protein